MAAKVKKVKIRRVRLDDDELYNEYFEEMKCLACVSTLQSYQFAHTLNVNLDRDFRLEMENMQDKNAKKYKMYFDKDGIRGIEYNIICNRNRTDFLIPELPKADYLILMNGMNLHTHLLNEIQSTLNQSSKISYTFLFDPMSLSSKAKEYLIL
jgi:hypothetical protein